MDFALSEEQQAIVELGSQILGDLSAPERLREVEAGADWFHRDLWNELAKAGLLGIALPTSVGGGGFSFLEACLLLERQGRTVSPVPLVSTVVASVAIAELGSADQQAAWLPGVVAGDTILTVALSEIGTNPRDPQLGAVRHDDGWALTGAKTAVPAVHLATAMVVPARDAEGEVRLFVVPTNASGLSSERQDTFNHEPQFHVDFDGVVVDAAAELVGSTPSGQAPIDWIVDRATVGLCALAAGVSDAGMRLTAGYVVERKQFDRAIGTFQAVGHRMADCYVDNEAIRLSMLQAASLLGLRQPGRRRGGGGQVLGLLQRQPGGPRRAPSARGHLHRPRLRRAPLLPVGQADRVPARRGHPPAGPPGPVAGRPAGQRLTTVGARDCGHERLPRRLLVGYGRVVDPVRRSRAAQRLVRLGASGQGPAVG